MLFAGAGTTYKAFKRCSMTSKGRKKFRRLVRLGRVRGLITHEPQVMKDVLIRRTDDAPLFQIVDLSKKAPFHDPAFVADHLQHCTQSNPG